MGTLPIHHCTSTLLECSGAANSSPYLNIIPVLNYCIHTVCSCCKVHWWYSWGTD